jgi:hypothetical protein
MGEPFAWMEGVLLMTLRPRRGMRMVAEPAR